MIIHPHTENAIVRFAAQPSHAVLLVGPEGVGKGSLALRLAAEVARLTQEALPQHPYFSHVTPEKNTIPIEAVRSLQKFLQLKTLGTSPYRRIIIIEQADRMTTEAQNAFLKLLEEPPADTLLVLTSGNQRSLLPTIISRLQTIAVHPPESEALKALFTGKGKETTLVAQAYHLSGGMPGIMSALLDGDNTHPLLAHVSTAKELLQKPTYERLAMVEGLSKQKETFGYVLDILARIARTGLSQAAGKDETAKVKRWHHILKQIANAQAAMAANANTKLVVTNIMLGL